MGGTKMSPKRRLNKYFRDFGYRVIRLKYFIMIVVALILEIATLSIYLLNGENIVELELFSVAILYGATSTIIVILAIGVIVLMRMDKRRDKNKIRTMQEFMRDYRKLANRHSPGINGLVNRFDGENSNIDAKINYAILLEEKYTKFLEDFSNLKIPSFLDYACSCESKHLNKEKELYNGSTGQDKFGIRDSPYKLPEGAQQD
jgi:hypothetical protein